MATTYKEKLTDPRWQRKRLEILTRDNYTCQKCQSTEKQLQVHHRHYISHREPWDYPSELLITLCYVCHKTEEDCADMGPEMFRTLHFFGFYNTEIRDYLNKLIETKLAPHGRE